MEMIRCYCYVLVWLLLLACCCSLHQQHKFRFSPTLNSHLLTHKATNQIRSLKRGLLSLFMIEEDVEQKDSKMLTLVKADKDLYNALNAGPIAPIDRMFLINGWRWHTMSVIRDLHRLFKLMKKIQASNKGNVVIVEELIPATEFVVNFNYRALANIEQNLFHPWLLANLPTSISSTYIARIQDFHKQLDVLSKRVVEDYQLLIRSTKLPSTPSDLGDNTRSSSDIVWNSIYSNTKSMIKCAQSIQVIQEEVLVPMVEAYIPKKEQDRFNRKVLLGLGLINSQIHLVSMYEAIKDNPKEFEVFKKQIPSAARLTLPIWRKRLYAPKAKFLD